MFFMPPQETEHRTRTPVHFDGQAADWAGLLVVAGRFELPENRFVIKRDSPERWLPTFCIPIQDHIACGENSIHWNADRTRIEYPPLAGLTIHGQVRMTANHKTRLHTGEQFLDLLI